MTGVSPSGIFSTTNYNDPKEVTMDTIYTDYDTEGYDPEDYNIDYDELAEMAEEYSYGHFKTERADDFGFDFDNYGYAD